jgi:galactosyltransferase
MTQSSQKTLFAIISCRHRPQWRQLLRETWIKGVPRDRATALFFVGRGEPLVDSSSDTIELDCSDKYEHLPEKVRAICKWALEHNFSFMLKTDEDALLRPNDFLNSGYDRHEYSGRSNRPESPYPVPYGFGYCMSRKCMEIISKASLPSNGSLDDERFCAETLSQHNIFLHDDRRYFLHQLRIPIEERPRRPLRAPKRPHPDQSMWGNTPDPNCFSFCVHVAAELEEKLEEYRKLWIRHRES